MAHLRQPATQPLKPRGLYWHFPHYRHAPGPYSIIPQDQFKLIKFHEGIHELYDLQQDLGEQHNLAAEMPEMVEQLDARLMRELRAMHARLPVVNPNYAPNQQK